MKDFIFNIVTQLVDEPENVEVLETDQGMGNILLEIKVATIDMGKIIGKQGKTIKALRDLVKILAVKQNLRVNLVIKE